MIKLLPSAPATEKSGLEVLHSLTGSNLFETSCPAQKCAILSCSSFAPTLITPNAHTYIHTNRHIHCHLFPTQ